MGTVPPVPVVDLLNAAVFTVDPTEAEVLKMILFLRLREGVLENIKPEVLNNVPALVAFK